MPRPRRRGFAAPQKLLRSPKKGNPLARLAD
jgi:hypothetical protein